MQDKGQSELAERCQGRIPPNLIKWEAVRDWMPKIERHLPPRLRRDLLAHIQPNESAVPTVDSFCWLGSAENLVKDAVEPLACRLSSYEVRTFHACRPMLPENYFKSGIRVLRQKKHMNELFRFLQSSGRACSLSALEAVASQVDADIDRGKAFTALDRRELTLGHSGHYLIWGSELWSAILLRLGGCACRDLLLNRGIPTLFEVDLPLSTWTPEQRIELARRLLQAWACGLKEPLRRVPLTDFTFVANTDIPASQISGHHHPSRIRFPNGLGIGWYRNPFRKCAACLPGDERP